MPEIPAAAPAAAARRMPNPAALLIAQVQYQFRLIFATPGPLVIGMVLPVVLMFTASIRHGAAGVPQVAGYAAFGLTMTAWNIHGVRLVQAREAGILKRWRATPLPRWYYFAGRIVTSALAGALAGAIALLAGVLFYGVHLTVTAAAGVLITLVLAGLAWAACSTAMARVVPVAEAATAIYILVYFPVMIISGVFGSISDEPHWLATLASYLPAQPMIDAMTRSIRHVPAAPFLPARDIIVLAVWIIAGTLIAVAVFRWEPHRPAGHHPARPAAARPAAARPAAAHPAAATRPASTPAAGPDQ
jgi:ABC-2 type transport system permease protein